MSDTVKIRVEIDIVSAGTHDTGVTVEEWNALTDEERGEISRQCWDTESQHNNGGMWVETEGAEGL